MNAPPQHESSLDFPLPWPFDDDILKDVQWKPSSDAYRHTSRTPLPFVPMASLPKTETASEHAATVIQTPYRIGSIFDDKTLSDDMRKLSDETTAALQKRLREVQAAYYEKAMGAPIATADPPVEPLSIDAMLEWFRLMDEMLHRSKADQIKKLMKAGVMVHVNRNMPDGSMVMTVAGDYERAVEIALEEFAKEKARD